MDYLWCRIENIRSNEWEQCVRAPLDVNVIRQCAEGAEGRRLLTESFQQAAALGITGSPTWLLNNRYEMQGRNPADIVSGYCEHNQVPRCEQPVQVAEAAGEIPSSPPSEIDVQRPSQPRVGVDAGLVLPGCEQYPH
jgi:hypothetical protein